MKITVIGRPGAAVEQGQAVVLALTSEKVPNLPDIDPVIRCGDNQHLSNFFS